MGAAPSIDTRSFGRPAPDEMSGAGSFHEQMSRLDACLWKWRMEIRRGKESGTHIRGGVGCHRQKFHARIRGPRLCAYCALAQGLAAEANSAYYGKLVIEVGGFNCTRENGEEEAPIHGACECGEFGSEIVVGGRGLGNLGFLQKFIRQAVIPVVLL